MFCLFVYLFVVFICVSIFCSDQNLKIRQSNNLQPNLRNNTICLKFSHQKPPPPNKQTNRSQTKHTHTLLSQRTPSVSSNAPCIGNQSLTPAPVLYGSAPHVSVNILRALWGFQLAVFIVCLSLIS